MKRWYDNWDAITPIFKFSPDVGKVIYTTNAIESLNSTYRKLNRQRSVFPSDTSLLKALYLATFEATKSRCCILSCISSLCLKQRCCQAKKCRCCKQTLFHPAFSNYSLLLFHFFQIHHQSAVRKRALLFF